MNVVLATYRSQCHFCGDMIEIDNPIAEFDGDWLHKDCAEEASE